MISSQLITFRRTFIQDFYCLLFGILYLLQESLESILANTTACWRPRYQLPGRCSDRINSQIKQAVHFPVRVFELHQFLKIGRLFAQKIPTLDVDLLIAIRLGPTITWEPLVETIHMHFTRLKSKYSPVCIRSFFTLRFRPRITFFLLKHFPGSNLINPKCVNGPKDRYSSQNSLHPSCRTTTPEPSGPTVAIAVTKMPFHGFPPHNKGLTIGQFVQASQWAGGAT